MTSPLAASQSHREHPPGRAFARLVMEPLSVYYFSTLVVMGGVALGVGYLGRSPGELRIRPPWAPIDLEAVSRFDGLRYVQIAEKGYH